MGYTGKTIELIDLVIDKVQTVIDLGAQNDYRANYLPAPYVRNTYYKEKDKQYDSIDLSLEDGAFGFDLSQLHEFPRQYDLLVDAGTSEHVGNNGKFGWRAIYNCWKNKHNLVKVGGFMVNENPKTGNWPGHGFNYYTTDFYKRLAAIADYSLINLGEHPAMGNTTDGWNVYCVMQKTKENFITFEQFKECGIKTN